MFEDLRNRYIGKPQGHALIERTIGSRNSECFAKPAPLFERRIAKNGTVCFEGEYWEIPAYAGVEHGQYVYVRPCPWGAELVVEINAQYREEPEQINSQDGQDAEKQLAYIPLKPFPPRTLDKSGCHCRYSIRPLDMPNI